MIHRFSILFNLVALVVNCFQNPILEDDSQEEVNAVADFFSCELLSESYFRG